MVGCSAPGDNASDGVKDLIDYDTGTGYYPDVVEFDRGIPPCGLKSFEIEPGGAVVLIDSPKPPTDVAFTAYDIDLMCGIKTPLSATFSIDDPSLGAFSGSVLKPRTDFPGLGAFTLVRAEADGRTATSSLTLIRLVTGTSSDLLVILPFGAKPKYERGQTLFELSSGSPAYDVGTHVSNDPANPPGIDASKLVASMQAFVGPGCDTAPTKDSDGDGVDDTFVGLASGRKVCFVITAKPNTVIPSKSVPRFVAADIDFVGQPGSVKLGSIKSVFWIPAK